MILELPLPILFDILSKLPIRSISRVRCVCRTFLHILSDPQYALTYLNRAPTTLLLRVSPQYNPPPLTFFYPHAYLIDLQEQQDAANCAIHGHYPFPAFNKHRIYSLPAQGNTQLVGSCNGLICLRCKADTPVYYVCNPLLGEFVVLPPPPPVLSPDSICSTYFGFSPRTNQYKVIRFESTRDLTMTQMYTLGSESWRKIENAPWPRPTESAPHPAVLLNGTLHLIVDGRPLSMYSLDLEKEQFKQVPLPTHLDEGYMETVSRVGMSVMGNFICLCYVCNITRSFEVWSMDDYGATRSNSWTKKFAADCNKLEMHLKKCGQPLMFSNNGDMWMMYSNLYVYKYDLKNQTLRAFDICGIDESFEAIAFVLSFVSLKDTLAGGSLKVQTCYRG